MLANKLKEYMKQDVYPFHMPGHKRVPLDEWNPYEMDITEIDGFDNLHHAEEILQQTQQRAAELYGAKKTFYLINGSTCGILAAISACMKKQGKILMARNSHKSAYNALFLRELEVIYLYPQLTSMGLQGQIRIEEVEKMLREHEDIQAIWITSPTYDGVVSDVRAIAELVHQYDIPLLVDAAHGAHFGFTDKFPENPVQLGADVVIESVHKTLPAFTQTALLHVCSERVDIEKIEHYLSIYETSSPSYILMAGIDRCIRYMEKQGRVDLQKLSDKLERFYQRTSALKNIKVLRKEDFTKEEAYDFDNSKILIFSTKKQVTGAKLHEILLEQYHLQMEMVSGQYVLALCSLMDTEEGFVRLADALAEIDRSEIWVHTTEAEWSFGNLYRRQERIFSIYQAEELGKEEVCLENAVGRISANYLFLYPPGIPFVVPGELITENVIQDILDCQSKGIEVINVRLGENYSKIDCVKIE